MWGSLLVDALVVGLVVQFVAWLSVWLVHPQLILLEFVAVVAVAWKNVLVHFWRSQLLNVLQQTTTWAMDGDLTVPYKDQAQQLVELDICRTRFK